MHFKPPYQARQPTFASGNRTTPAERRPEQTGKYDGKKGVRLCLYKCRGSEVEKGLAWAGQARVCRGKHERDFPYPLHT
jgi:hypothetical protein